VGSKEEKQVIFQEYPLILDPSKEGTKGASMKTSGTPSQKVSLTQLDLPKEEPKVNIEETRDTLVDSNQSRLFLQKKILHLNKD